MSTYGQDNERVAKAREKDPMTPRLLLLIAPILLALAGPIRARPDAITFGNPVSEKAHAFAGEKTRTVAGGLGEPCRCLEPGGELSFELASVLPTCRNGNKL